MALLKQQRKRLLQQKLRQQKSLLKRRLNLGLGTGLLVAGILGR
jgi:hypothetical protein